MTHSYQITGMTCNNCVGRVKSELLKLGDITEVNVQLESPQATITMSRHIALEDLQAAVGKAGKYEVREVEKEKVKQKQKENEKRWIEIYKPVLLIGGYIIAVSLLVEWVNGGFEFERWMSHFMAGFFLSFSFFKMLDLKAFAASYASYDVIAKRWMGWGYVYAFIELALGLLYLIEGRWLLVNFVTLAVMSISLVGVLQSVLAKRRIQCACLGAVFNLPMSTITIVEDALMIVMSALMFVI